MLGILQLKPLLKQNFFYTIQHTFEVNVANNMKHAIGCHC